ncbi:MAG: tetratricopeptide repeat protein [Lachnospiraceae bacterium]|nr:tetratricopeptide repeat protein [Lachnospiraceae bacterium]
MMKKAIFLFALAAILTACKKSNNLYQKRYEQDGVKYEYSIVYPDGIDYAIAERYASFDIANDNRSIVMLMDSLIDTNTHLDFWGDDYYRAMKETMPYDSILPRLLRVQDHEPSNPTVYSSIGYTYNHLNNTLKALEYFHKGLDIAPDNSKLWYGLGLVTLQNGDTISAISHFAKSLDLATKQNMESQVTLSQFMLEKYGSDTLKVKEPISETANNTWKRRWNRIH